ncbi:PHP domain-containing protein [Mobiluncus curtisii]|uniref:PHP domain-containing protein n=1 Tax=Mobiluncus curtisii TaxID=2051 RepID=UPI0014705249|nr:PHP domain-containing protein [Mobiluncus curtisii]NMW44858.1 PHP domain-containing protein [Mobiluncus curtisii]NMW83004.1 PHP domain-containing protein [Mobiluncus curtisii]NMW88522.1 PHP domain-containing protein [Mobiluncus curtisii]NMW98600.1 PHP domain-containing protein [Mobiluncus curtisii]
MALKIDPHVHSALSDGTDSPRDLLEKARAAGLDVIGAVDHDTFDHWEPFRVAHAALMSAGVRPPAVILGTEISTSVELCPVHLLNYLPDPRCSNVREILKTAHRDRRERMQRMVSKISQDYPLTWSDVEAEITGLTPGRPHIGDALVRKGYFQTRSEAFEKVLNPGSPYYVTRPVVDSFAVVEAICADGGVPVLAHPFSVTRSKRKLDPGAVRKLAQIGLRGIEVNHREHDASARQLAAELAQELDLFVSGASDYHGAGKPNQLGENTMPAASLRQILAMGASPLLGELPLG